MSYLTTVQLLEQLGDKNPRMKLELRALQACYDFWDQKPEIVDRLWEDVFMSAPRQVTIPHYLAFVEGWNRQEFCEEFEITTPTYYRWVLTTELPFKRRRDFLNAIDMIDDPVDLALMLEAKDNEDQWVLPGKSRDYKPSRKMIGWAESKMKTRGELDVREYKSQNRYRSKLQMRTLARMRHWTEISDGVFIAD
jgi:hypothetical protein